METEVKRKIWQKPWSYVESISIVFGLYLIGIVLQLNFGFFIFAQFSWPVNSYVGSALLLFVIALSIRRNSFFTWLASISLSVALICALLIQALIMGITPQIAGELTTPPTAFDLLGFTKMTSSWPFVILFLFTIIALEAAILNRMRNLKWSDYPFYLNHFGLLILFFSSGFGSPDLKRYVMYVDEKNEQPEWRVYSQNSDVLELPIAISLHDFVMEEYLPKLSIINRATGNSIPYKNPDYLQLESGVSKGVLASCEIHIDTLLPQAVRYGENSYRAIDMPGSCPAVHLSIEFENQTKKGWVCSGNYAQLYKTLVLNDTLSLVMTRPEPKYFASKIEVFTAEGEQISATVEVNKPLEIGDWTIYQYGYDNDAGRASSYSSFELVYDPWLKFVYGGIVLIALGSLSFLWIGNRKRKEKRDE